jgi:hypothetical protein
MKTKTLPLIRNSDPAVFLHALARGRRIPCLLGAHPTVRRFQLVLLAFSWLLAVSFSQAQESAARDASIAFVNVNVLPMDSERVLANQTVITRGDRIIEVGPSEKIKVPEGAKRIAAEGKYLIPGLGEMHGHNPPPGSSEEYIEQVYFLFVANGVTTVRSMLGWPGQLELRDQVNSGELLGPTLFLAGPSFSGVSIKTAAQAEERVREQKKEGWDLLKVHPGLKRDHYDAMARTAKEVDIQFAGHIPAEVGLVHAIKSGQETIDHLDGYLEYLEGDRGPLDPAKLEEAVRLTREHGVWVVPTMRLWETIIGAADLEKMSAYPELKYMPAAEVERWKSAYKRLIERDGFDKERALRMARNRQVLLKALQDGGVKIIFGTDAPQQFSVPGFSIHREVRGMADSGLTPYEILRSATRNVGEYYKAVDQFGTITAGSRADLVLLEANPLENLAHLEKRSGVMLRGRWLPETEIQERLSAMANGK